MATSKNSAALRRPAAPTWAQLREAERVRYAQAQPSRLSWKTAGTYDGAELQHRSSDNRMRMPGLGVGAAGGAR